MKKLFGISLLAAAMMVVSPVLFAAEPANEVKAAVKEEVKAAKDATKKGEEVDKTGTIEVKAAEKGEKFDTITLKAGAETFKILPGKGAKKLMDELKKLAGKEVTVTGTLVAANAKHPLPAIKMESYKEAGAAAAPAPAAAPADAKPADAPAAAPADAKPADAPAAGK